MVYVTVTTQELLQDCEAIQKIRLEVFLITLHPSRYHKSSRDVSMMMGRRYDDMCFNGFCREELPDIMEAFDFAQKICSQDIYCAILHVAFTLTF